MARAVSWGLACGVGFGRDASFLQALDLGHAAFMDHKLDRAEAHGGELLADNFNPKFVRIVGGLKGLGV